MCFRIARDSPRSRFCLVTEIARRREGNCNLKRGNRGALAKVARLDLFAEFALSIDYALAAVLAAICALGQLLTSQLCSGSLR
jgi:hypothetical protein